MSEEGTFKNAIHFKTCFEAKCDKTFPSPTTSYAKKRDKLLAPALVGWRARKFLIFFKVLRHPVLASLSFEIVQFVAAGAPLCSVKMTDKLVCFLLFAKVL